MVVRQTPQVAVIDSVANAGNELFHRYNRTIILSGVILYRIDGLTINSQNNRSRYSLYCRMYRMKAMRVPKRLQASLKPIDLSSISHSLSL